MEIKEEFCEIMTVHTAAIYHDMLGLDFVLGDGEIIQIWSKGELIWEVKKCTEEIL